MNKPFYDFLIVGQGLAGSILAYTLIQKGYSIKLIDNRFKGSSSIISAGIINPFTGPRLKLTENFFDKFKQASYFYQAIEKKLNTKLFHSVLQQRFLASSMEYGYYLKRALAYPKSLKLVSKDMLTIHDTAIVNVHHFLNLSREYFTQNESLENGYFDHTLVQFNKHQLIYKDTMFNHLIFCEGHQNIYNPFFKHDLFQLSKGSIMQVEIQNLEKTLYNWGQWLSPNFNGQQDFFLGASYHWDLKHEPDFEQEFHVLLAKLPAYLSHLKIQVKRHQTGIRPTTHNRQTLIQPSPVDDRLWMFNGFGSKGCLEIPYHAEKFANSFDKK